MPCQKLKNIYCEPDKCRTPSPWIKQKHNQQADSLQCILILNTL